MVFRQGYQFASPACAGKPVDSLRSVEAIRLNVCKESRHIGSNNPILFHRRNSAGSSNPETSGWIYCSGIPGNTFPAGSHRIRLCCPSAIHADRTRPTSALQLRHQKGLCGCRNGHTQSHMRQLAGTPRLTSIHPLHCHADKLSFKKPGFTYDYYGRLTSHHASVSEASNEANRIEGLPPNSKIPREMHLWRRTPLQLPRWVSYVRHSESE
jgi:hypothetical protein